MTIGGKIGATLQAMRIHHWVKNLFVVAPLFFSPMISDPQAWIQCGIIFAAFCLLSSAIYLINDIFDRHEDALHPAKRNRPIASGSLGVAAAATAAIVLAVCGLAIAWFAGDGDINHDDSIRLQTLGICGAFIVWNLSYCLWLKKIPLIDVGAIAIGFVLRATAGMLATEGTVSLWLIACLMTLCIFIALIKRRSEIAAAQRGAPDAELEGIYDGYRMQKMIRVAEAATVIIYSLYCIAPDITTRLGSPYLVWTLPLLIYGMFRYDIVTAKSGECDAAKSVLRDRGMWIIVTLYAAITAIIVAFGRDAQITLASWPAKHTAPIYNTIQVLADKWWTAGLAFGLAVVATPIIRKIAYRFQIVDRPDDLLKPHGRPVAYLGGVAMWLGFIAAICVYAIHQPGAEKIWRELSDAFARGDWSAIRANLLWNMMAAGLAATVMMLAGLLDDLRNIRPIHKLSAQATATAVLMLGGIGEHIAPAFIGSMGWIDPPTWITLPVSCVMCFLLIASTCNATNLIDGLDGLCGGVLLLAAVGMAIMAIFLATWGNCPVGDLRIVLCLAVAGAILGFLPFNYHPAGIFMGDAGSMMLGMFIAMMMALFCNEGTARWPLAAGLIFCIPILDSALAITRRIKLKRNIFSGDRSHLYDQLVDRGMPAIKVVKLFYLLAVVAAILGVLAAFCLSLRWALAFYVALFVAVWMLLARNGMIAPKKDLPQNRPENRQ